MPRAVSCDRRGFTRPGVVIYPHYFEPSLLIALQVENPFLDLAFQPPTVERFALRKSFKGHLNSVSAVAFHPRKVGTGYLLLCPSFLTPHYCITKCMAPVYFSLLPRRLNSRASHVPPPPCERTVRYRKWVRESTLWVIRHKYYEVSYLKNFPPTGPAGDHCHSE